jgi:hypothetical protein
MFISFVKLFHGLAKKKRKKKSYRKIRKNKDATDTHSTWIVYT